MKHSNNNDNIRVCICCGKKFYYCNRCGKGDKNTGISTAYDTYECKELVNALSGYSMNMWGKEKIQDILNVYNITDYTKYKQSIQDKLNELFSAKEPEIKYSPIEVKEEPQEVNEIQDINESTTEQNENETTKEVRPQRKRKSRRKKVVLSNEIERIQSDEGDNL